MYTQANECPAEPPSSLAQDDGLGLLCLLWAGPGALQPPRQRHWGGRVGRAGMGVTTCSMQKKKKKGNSGIRTDHSQPFLVLMRKCGTLGPGAALQGWVRSCFDHSNLSEVQEGAQESSWLCSSAGHCHGHVPGMGTQDEPRQKFVF